MDRTVECAGRPPAATLLRDQATYVQALNRAWTAQATTAWGEAHDRLSRLGDALDAGGTRHGPETRTETLRRLAWTAEVHGVETVLPEARALTDASPEDADFRYLAGRLLADAGEVDAIEHPEIAMAADPVLCRSGFAISTELLGRLGLVSEERAFEVRWLERVNAAVAKSWSAPAPAVLRAWTADPELDEAIAESPELPPVPALAERAVDRPARVVLLVGTVAGILLATTSAAVLRAESPPFVVASLVLTILLVVVRRRLPGPRPVLVWAAADALVIEGDDEHQRVEWPEMRVLSLDHRSLVLRGPPPVGRVRLSAPDGAAGVLCNRIMMNAMRSARSRDPAVWTFVGLRSPWWWALLFVGALAAAGAFFNPAVFLIAAALLVVVASKVPALVREVSVDGSEIRVHADEDEVFVIDAVVHVAIVAEWGGLAVLVRNANDDLAILPVQSRDAIDLYAAITHARQHRAAAPRRPAPARARAEWLTPSVAAGVAVVLYLPVLSGLALSQAARFGSASAVTVLLAAGSPIDGRGDKGRTAVYEAAKHGHLAIVQELARRGGDFAKPSRRPVYTPLHVAASRGRVDVVRFLLDNGADPNAVNAYGREPLADLAELDDSAGIEIARLLLERGADPSRVDRSGWTPLHIAVAASNERMVRILIEHGASPNERSHGGRTTPLIRAAIEDDSAMIVTLIDLGADLEARDGKTGRTPLSVAAMEENATALRALIAAGAELEPLDGGGFSPLALAAWFNRSVTARILLEAGSPPQAQGHRPGTALHVAAARGSVEVVYVLLEHGADVNATALGRTPLSLARENRMLEVERALIKAGARE